jgi:hypothetical protein
MSRVVRRKAGAPETCWFRANNLHSVIAEQGRVGYNSVVSFDTATDNSI